MIITIVLETALVLLAWVQVGCVPAMGPKNRAVQTADNNATNGSQTAKDHNRQSKDDISSKESGTHNRDKPSMEKKPRLKYRDAPGCSC